MEEWKVVKEHNKYMISSLGRVKSLKYNKERILKPMVDNKGYLRIDLDNKTYKIHRLVAEHFIDNPDKLPQVNHKDEDKSNNSYLNLEWCNNKYNANYGSRVKKVNQYDCNDNLIRTWSSMKQASLELNIQLSHICSCCRGNRKSSGGYKWKYVN